MSARDSRSTFRRLRRCFAIGLLAVYAACVTHFIRIDDMVLVTRTGRLEAPGEANRIVARTTDGHEVEIFSIRAKENPSNPDCFVLRFSGNARAETMVRTISNRWGGQHTETWVMNYPGSGGSEGPAQLDRIAPAALAAFDSLRQRASGKPIFVDGNSFGAAVALCVAANRPVAGIMLQNPPPIRELARSHFRGPMLWLFVWPVSSHVPADLDAIANASRCTARAVFIHSIHDRDVPDRLQQLVRDAYRSPMLRLNVDGTHDTQPDEADPADLATAVRWLLNQGAKNSDASLASNR